MQGSSIRGVVDGNDPAKRTPSENPKRNAPISEADFAKLRAQSEAILRQPIEQRLRQLEAEADFFASARPLDD